MAGQQTGKLFEHFVPITLLWARFHLHKQEERKDLLNIPTLFFLIFLFFSSSESIQLNIFIAVSTGYLPLEHCSEPCK